MTDVVWREVKNYPVLVNGVNVAATSPFTSNLAMCCKDEEEEIHTRQTSRTQVVAMKPQSFCSLY